MLLIEGCGGGDFVVELFYDVYGVGFGVCVGGW